MKHNRLFNFASCGVRLHLVRATMSETRPLEAMEEMVQKLPPVNKKAKKKKETKIPQPSTSSAEQEQALANLLDDLITADPSQPTHPQPIPATTEVKNHNLNVCPFHQCNLILFEARSNDKVYIKCQVDQCPIFMHEDSAYHYMSNVCGRLHESYLRRKKILICGCEEAVSLRVSKTENNPGRPYFICRDRDCRFFQWADVELSKKNKNKQAKR